MKLKQKVVPKDEKITEDGIADWVYKNNGLLLTRKYNNINTRGFDNLNYVCLTGYKNVLNIFEKILHFIESQVILIIIESDVIKISDVILNNDKIKTIYTWNKEINHDKIKCLPIGLNKDRHYFIRNINQAADKTKLLLINFDVNSDISRRKIRDNKKIMSIASFMKYVPYYNSYMLKSYTDGSIKVDVTDKKYYEEMKNYKFVLSPRGGGEDCHRTWEALYLGCIPIVLSSSINEVYQDLPVLIVNDWNELSKEFLEQKWQEFKSRKWDMKKCYLDYWLNQFENRGVQNKTHFITYGNHVFERAKKRLCREATKFYNFNSVKGYGPEDLPQYFREKYIDVLSMKRGGGYWIWKYILLKNKLEEITDGDVVIYLDAGCTFNPRGIKRFNEYIMMLKESEYGMLSFQMHDQIEKWWTTKEIFNYFNIDVESECGNSGQYLGGILFIKKCVHSLKFINDVLKILDEDRLLFTDHYNDKGQASYFKENRHEQSITSMWRKINGSVVIPKDETYFANFGCKESLKYPIWATRRRD